MIPKEQLMIGDWVRIGNNYAQVRELCEQLVGLDYSDGYDCEMYRKIEPIPLTPEILEKNGFVTYKNCPDNTYYEENDDNVAIIIGTQWHYFEAHLDNEYPNVDLQVEFKYVHELQHILRMIGEEKEIEL